MKANNFAVMPTVSINRSKFKRSSQYKTAGKLGELIPVYCDEVLPGDTRKIDLGSLTRLSNMIFPVMDNIYMDYYAFFVPNRLVWEHWKEFMGENNTSAGIYQGTEKTIPMVDIYACGIPVGSVGDYLGLPILTADGSKHSKVSTLPIRGYRLIYNRWFRDQNVISPVPVTLTDSTSLYDWYNAMPFKVAKPSNYFTRALPYAQKGNPVSIPLGTKAPVYAGELVPGMEVVGDDDSGFVLSSYDRDTGIKYALLPTTGRMQDLLDFIADEGTGVGYGGAAVTCNDSDVATGSFLTNENAYTEQGDVVVAPANLWANLSNATAATINQLRFAFQLQKLLEKDAIYGSRYWELLKAHFGVEAPDASLQDPELLGHHRTNIRIDQVVQTTGIDQGSKADNELGQIAGISTTGDSCNLFTKSFTEHGYIFILACMRHDETFGQGIDRHFTRKVRTDYYFPVFANLGSQKVLNKELFVQGTDGKTADADIDNAVFGYQEAWAEYRYKPSKITGLVNPSVSNSLGYVTLADNFAELPTLSQSFIEQGRGNLARVLQTGDTGPDFILDLAFQDIAVRPMPLYSIPGLIDHH